MAGVTFDPALWAPVPGFDLTDITYHRAVDAPVVRVAFDRPEVRNAFRPHTVDELYRALDHARRSSDVGAVLLTGNGPSAKDGGVNYQMSIWSGIFAPKGTPKEAIDKLAVALDKALDDPTVIKRLNDLGGSVPKKSERTPASFDALVKAEIKRWKPILQDAAPPAAAKN